MKDVIERLNQYYEYKRFTNEEIGQMLGCSAKTVANNRSERRGLKLSNLLVVLEHNRDLSAEWLLRGTGLMIASESNVHINVCDVNGSNVITASPNATITGCKEDCRACKKPLIPISVSRQPNLNVRSEYNNGNLDLPMTPVVNQFGDYSCGFITPNDAMAPMFKTGDKLALKVQDSEYIINGNAYVIDTTRGMMLRYVYEFDDENYMCKAIDNSRYTDMLLPKSQVYSLYVIMGMLRTFC